MVILKGWSPSPWFEILLQTLKSKLDSKSSTEIYITSESPIDLKMMRSYFFFFFFLCLHLNFSLPIISNHPSSSTPSSTSSLDSSNLDFQSSFDGTRETLQQAGQFIHFDFTYLIHQAHLISQLYPFLSIALLSLAAHARELIQYSWVLDPRLYSCLALVISTLLIYQSSSLGFSLLGSLGIGTLMSTC